MYPSSKQIEEALTCVFTSLKIDDLELKREYKAALKAVVASNTIACLIFYQRVFVVHFVVDRLERVRDRKLYSCCFFSYSLSSKVIRILHVLRRSMTR